jgi:hypothetical protein
MVVVPEQQQHMKYYMEGTTSTFASLYEKHDGDELYVNKLSVNNSSNSVKKSSLLHICKNNG